MIPSSSWFHSSLQDRAAWFQNFSDNFQAVGGTLGFLPAVMTQVANDNEDFQFAAASTVTITAYAKAFRLWRKTVTEGNVGDPAAQFPANVALAPPNQVPTGIFERLDELVQRIRVAPNYTPEIGGLLGIIPQSPNRPPAEDLKPTIKVTSSDGNYTFTMNATRYGLPAYKVQVQRSGQTSWVDSGFSTDKSFTVTVSPTTPGQPERVLVRAVLLQNSLPVGIPSDPAFVTVNP